MFFIVPYDFDFFFSVAFFNSFGGEGRRSVLNLLGGVDLAFLFTGS